MRVPDGEFEDVTQTPGAVVAKQCHPPAEGSRHTGGEGTAARHLGQPHPTNPSDGRRRGRGALATDHIGSLLLGVPKDDRHLASESVEVRLYDLQHKSRRHRCVGRIATAFEHGHAARRGEPVRGAHCPERAFELRSRGDLHCARKGYCLVKGAIDSLLFEPFSDEFRTEMDVDLAQPASAGIHKLVSHARRTTTICPAPASSVAEPTLKVDRPSRTMKISW